ncbi:MAG TPA: hypothetical protein VFT95_04905, partial [Micromonosporaceae bacterium]|nr:hypothetical protein [Micromonosporaceae bacterium]
MPPTDLSRLRLPGWAIPTGPRAQSVPLHRIAVQTAWWRREIHGRGLPGQPPDRPALTRQEVWRHSADLHRGDTVFTLLWHALAWGSGSHLRQNARRLDSIAANPDRARDLLRAAAALAPADPVRAYTVLRPLRTEIAYLGPSFFT